MRMTVVDVRIVRVLVSQHLMPMRMRMRLLAAPWERVLMLVMLVMPMRMGMFERLVCMKVLMTLLQVKPYA